MSQPKEIHLNQEYTASYEVENFIDPRPIFDALDRRDDQAIWQAESAAPSQQLFFERLREQIGHTTYESGAGRNANKRMQHYCSMLMIPVITPKGVSDNLTGKSTQATMKTIVKWLMGWMNEPYTITAFQMPLKYQEVSTWGPSAMRARLEQLITKDPSSVGTEPDFNFQMPPHAPALSFLMAAVHAPMEWAKLPPENPHADLDLTSKISGAMQFCAGEPADVLVLPPNFTSEAIRIGIVEWLNELHRCHGIIQWDAIPVSGNMVMLQLQLEGQDHWSSVPLRPHQIGLDGVQSVLEKVAGLCNTKSTVASH